MSFLETLEDFWWEVPQARRHEELFATVEVIRDTQQDRRDVVNALLQRYGNTDGRAYSANFDKAGNKLRQPIRLNVSRSAVDTVTAKMAKNRPAVTYLTEGGSYSQQRRAKKLSQFVSGIFHNTKAYQKALLAFRDATITGTGVLMPYRHPGQNKILLERVAPGELEVDEVEAQYGEPRTLYRTRYVDRRVLAKRFPAKREKIRNAKAYEADEYDGSMHRRVVADQLRVVEAWHLPSGPDAKDGRHTIAIDEATLLDEAYTRPIFPFVFIHWSEPVCGFWGTGLVEELATIQDEIDKLAQRIQAAMHLLGVPWVLLDAGAEEPQPSQLQNRTALILKYSGNKPEVSVHGTVHPEMFAHLDRLYQRAFEIAGVSQLSAQARKPSGLDAAVALREFHDIETERFMVVGRAFEQLFIDLAAQVIALAKEIDDDPDSEPMVVRAASGRELLRLEWKDVSLDEDAFVMKAFPTNFLGSTPSAQLQRVVELAQAEFIPRDMALQLLDFPDLDAFVSEKTAAVENIRHIIENLEDGGEYVAPEPFMDLALGLRMVLSAYLKGQTRGLEPERLEDMRRWLDEAQALQDLANTPQQALNAGVGAEEGVPAQGEQGNSPQGLTGQAAVDAGAVAPLPA